jgi:hypothetical protein
MHVVWTCYVCCYCDMEWCIVVCKVVTCFIFSADCTYEYSQTQMYVCMYVSEVCGGHIEEY